MKTKLIFVRHGFSESNKDRCFTGRADAKLSDIGLEQARRASLYLADTHIDKIYSSPLSRAVDTAKPIAKSHGLEIALDSGLCEIHGGDWEEKPISQMSEISPEAYKSWTGDLYHCKCPNGEAVSELYRRVKATVTRISEENTGKTICITTHATPIRVVTCMTLGLKPEEICQVPWCPNASINIISYENGSFTFEARDIVDHLEGLLTKLPSNV